MTTDIDLEHPDPDYDDCFDLDELEIAALATQDEHDNRGYTGCAGCLIIPIWGVTLIVFCLLLFVASIQAQQSEGVPSLTHAAQCATLYRKD